MIPLRLIPRSLLSHPIRTLLTAGSLTLAVFIVCCLQGLLTSLTAGVESASATRLIVQSAVSLFVDLPQSYQARIEQVPGVAEVCKFQWFGGYYQDRSSFFGQFGVDPERFLRAYPEVEVIDGSPETFLRERQACLVGQGLAQRFGFRPGQTVPIIGALFQRNDGLPWEFQVAGVYRARSPNVDENTLFFHYDYLDQALETGAATGPGGVGVYVLQVERGADPVQVMASVDQMFQDGPQRVQTTTEKEFQRQFVTMLGSVPTLLRSIGSGILFAIALAVLNTLLMAARERTRSFGVLKALGFTDATAFWLLLLESLFLCLGGGLLGVGLAKLSEPALRSVLGTMFPGYAISLRTALIGLSTALAVGVAAALVPALRVARLRPVEALREV